MGISQQGFFLHRFRGPRCTHDLLLRVWYPAFSNADQGAEDAAWAFGESAAQHLRTWWERYELRRVCAHAHEQTLLGEVSDASVEWADEDDEPLFGAGLRTLAIWVAPLHPPYLRMASAPFEGATRHEVFLLSDEDGRGDLSAPAGA